MNKRTKWMTYEERRRFLRLAARVVPYRDHHGRDMSDGKKPVPLGFWNPPLWREVFGWCYRGHFVPRAPHVTSSTIPRANWTPAWLGSRHRVIAEQNPPKPKSFWKNVHRNKRKREAKVR